MKEREIQERIEVTVSTVTPPSLFGLFLELENGSVDRAEIFTTDRGPKMSRYVFLEKFLRTVFMVFDQKP